MSEIIFIRKGKERKQVVKIEDKDGGVLLPTSIYNKGKAAYRKFMR